MPGIQLQDPVAQLTAGPVATVRPTATLRDAAAAMTADSVGLLVVVEPAAVVGVISERDIVRAAGDGVDLDDERVRDHLSYDLVMVEEDASLRRAAEVMAAAHVRHLAVTRDGDVVGVLSMRDLMTILVESLDDE